MRPARIALVVAALGCGGGLAAAGCSSDAASSGPASSVDGGVDAPTVDAATDVTSEDGPQDATPDAMTPVCASGAAIGADGACHPFGIQGCAPIFVGADGLCHPSLAKCPVGTIPQFSTGCVPVGIPGCAAVFLEADGLCHPSAAKCPALTIPVPTEGCVSIDPAGGCGAAPFGDVADAPASLYVDPTAPSGGDGTKSKPLVALAAAVAKVPLNGRVVLAAGTYPDPIVFQKSFEVVGRCASMVRVTGAQSLTNGAMSVLVYSGTTALRNVTIAGKASGLLGLGGAITLDHVHFEKAVGVAIFLAGAAGEASYVLVDGTTPMGSMWGGGLVLQQSSASFEKSAFVGNSGTTIQVSKGASLTLAGVVVQNTVAWTDGIGLGLEMDPNATATVSGSAFVGQIGRGAQAGGAASKLDIGTSLIEGTLLGGNGEAIGLLVFNGGAAQLTGSAMLANSWDGAVATGAASSLVMTGSLVSGTSGGQPDSYAVVSQLTASVSVVDTTIAATVGFGVVAGSQGDLSLDGVLVEGSTPPNADAVAGGLLGVENGTVTAHRSAFVGNAFAGVLVDNSAVAALDGVLVEASVPVSYGFGVGVYAENATASLSGCLVVDNVVAGILGAASATVTVDAVRVAGTKVGSVLFQGDPAAIPALADGLVVVGLASATVTSTVVTGCGRAGFIFDQASGSITSSAARANGYGVVLQGVPKPTLGDGNDFSSNTLANSVSDGVLAVPSGSVPTPKM